MDAVELEAAFRAWRRAWSVACWCLLAGPLMFIGTMVACFPDVDACLDRQPASGTAMLAVLVVLLGAPVAAITGAVHGAQLRRLSASARPQEPIRTAPRPLVSAARASATRHGIVAALVFAALVVSGAADPNCERDCSRDSIAFSVVANLAGVGTFVAGAAATWLWARSREHFVRGLLHDLGLASEELRSSNQRRARGGIRSLARTGLRTKTEDVRAARNAAWLAFACAAGLTAACFGSYGYIHCGEPGSCYDFPEEWDWPATVAGAGLVLLSAWTFVRAWRGHLRWQDILLDDVLHPYHD